MGFFSEIYGSWKEIQRGKYECLWQALGPGFFIALGQKRVLDIGCGTGYFESFLAEKGISANIIGADIEFTKNVSPFVLADGSDLPFRTGIFDVVVCIDTIHLISTSDFRRVLKQGGLTLFGVFFSESTYAKRLQTIRQKLAGFEILLEFETGGAERDYFVLARKL